MTLTTGLGPVATTFPSHHDVVVPRRTSRRGLGWWVVAALDLFAAGAALLVTAALTPGVGLPLFFVVVLSAWPVAVALTDGYSRMSEDPYALRVRPLLAAGAGIATAAWATLTVAPHVADGQTPRTLAAMTLLFAGGSVLASIGVRLLLPLVSPPRPVSVVLVGPEPDVRELLAEAERPARRTFAPVAVCLHGTDRDEQGAGEPWPVDVRHGVEDNLLDVIGSHDADAVVVVPGDGIGHRELRRWAAWLQDRKVQLLVSPKLRDVADARLGATRLGGAQLLQVRPARLGGPGQLLKGAVDRVAAAVLLFLLAPLLLLVTVLIRLDSPGPAWFHQTRVGRNGRPFTVHKFRTMTVDAHEVRHHLAQENESDRNGVLFKIRQDPRVTRVGAVLRKYSLDELPQLVNVLTGEMSLVGPRPALPEEVRGYSPDLCRRLVVKPGMTGLWQVSGRSDLSWEDTVRMDLQYVDNWSWSLDLSIAARTLGAVLAHKGAY
ncbi:MAG TPA: exopolysaccharide biosynthesis polyprenyl glycosylphosphotransferase [Nocardioides sp.]|uniref:exopolysaccharide biosynthesis polyprenyl glycosylphosphotransferase n=1 Tax=Nocardioides sp. TaxID=35761 RepID=UPI002E340B3A|nr:exopolysaccharide biosynthesis polyprenyl glycosylphosphotransferase [Nocardioides sp.]HEX5088995.1 exopolysaccharide biosynthesis polyprenyl glycosylphosphotransferase [Nocardioides sp.]